MRVLVCGDRNWGNQVRMTEVLDNFHKHIPITVLVEGEARGADRMAAFWAMSNGIRVERYPANWTRYHRGAGPIRNKQMLDSGIDEVLAFHDNIKESKGTRDMLDRARAANVRCVLYTRTAEYINEEYLHVV